jgi:hypothetical protein
MPMGLGYVQVIAKRTGNMVMVAPGYLKKHRAKYYSMAEWRAILDNS